MATSLIPPMPATLNEVMPGIYTELHGLAAAYMRGEREGHTLQPTALVNEAYLRLLSQRSVDFTNRAHVLGVAAQMMRRILLNHHEAKVASKRGGGLHIVCMETGHEPAGAAPMPFSFVDELLGRLTALHERQGKVAELRIFGGLTIEETAEFLQVSEATVSRDWFAGKLWLTRELKNSGN